MSQVVFELDDEDWNYQEEHTWPCASLKLEHYRALGCRGQPQAELVNALDPVEQFCQSKVEMTLCSDGIEVLHRARELPYPTFFQPRIEELLLCETR